MTLTGWASGGRSDKITGTYLRGGAETMTVREYGEIWRSSQVHRPSTARQVRFVLDVHLLSSAGRSAHGQCPPGGYAGLGG